MNLIKNSQTNEVLWYGPQIAFVSNGAYRTIEFGLGIAESNTAYIENVEPIDHFFVGVYAYDNGWSIMNQQAYDESMAYVTNKKSEEVRAERNKLLIESDWTQGKDVPDGISTPWATYRQALRDISNQPDFPWSVTWPSKPGTRSQPVSSGTQDV